MTSRQYTALQYWLEYSKLMRANYWIGYYQHNDGTLS